MNRSTGARWLIVSMLTLTAWPPNQADAKAGRLQLAVVADEHFNMSHYRGGALQRQLERASSALGFSHETTLRDRVRQAGISPQVLVAGRPPATLSKTPLDIVVGAVLKLASSTRADGRLDYQATLAVAAYEASTRKQLARFDGKSGGTASDAATARKDARSTLLRQALVAIRPALMQVARHSGVLLYIARDGLQPHPLRLTAWIAHLPQVASARLLPPIRTHEVIDLRPRNANASGSLVRALQKVGLSISDRRKLVWWGRWHPQGTAIALRCELAQSVGDPLMQQAAPALCPMLETALRNSAYLHRAVAGQRDALTLRVTMTKGTLHAAVIKRARIKAHTPLGDPSGLAQDIWQLARQLEEAALKTLAKQPLPAMDKLAVGERLTRNGAGALLASLAGRGPTLMGRGAQPGQLTLARPAGIRASVAGSSLPLAARGLTLRLPLQLPAAALQSLKRPKALTLTCELLDPQDKGRDVLLLPLIAWPPSVVSPSHLDSYGSLINPHGAKLHQLMAWGYGRAAGVRALQSIDRALWLPLFSYGLIAALKPTLVGEKPSSMMLRYHQPVNVTVKSRKGTQRDMALLYASLIHANGGKTRLWLLNEGIVVAADTGWLLQGAGVPTLLKRNLLQIDGTLWLPIFVTDGRPSFVEAWARGRKILRKAGKRANRHSLEVLTSPLKTVELPERLRQPLRLWAGGLDATIEQAGQQLAAKQQMLVRRWVKAAKLNKAKLEKRLKLAARLLRIKATERARGLIEGYLLVNIKSKRGHQLLAVAYAYQGAFGLAQTHFRKAGRSRDVRLGMALMALLLGERETARKSLEGLGGRGKKVALALGLYPDQKGSPRWNVSPDPWARALGRLSGSNNLALRQRLLGKKADPDRRLIQRALDLLRY